MRTCHIDGTEIEDEQICPVCMAAFKNRRDAATMTPEERAAEFEQYLGPLQIPFSDLHKRIEELVGRDVWTHELARPDALIAEIRAQQPASFADVLAKIPADKQVIIAVTEEDKE